VTADGPALTIEGGHSNYSSCMVGFFYVGAAVFKLVDSGGKWGTGTC